MKNLFILISFIFITVNASSQSNIIDSLKTEKQKVMFMNGYHSGDKITNESVKSKLDELDKLIEYHIDQTKSDGELEFDSSSEAVSQDEVIDKIYFSYDGCYPFELWWKAIEDPISKLKTSKGRDLARKYAMESINGLKVYYLKNKSYMYLKNLFLYDDQTYTVKKYKLNPSNIIAVDHVKYLKDKYIGKEVIMFSKVASTYIEDIDTLTYHTVSSIKIGLDNCVYLHCNDGFKVNMSKYPELNNKFNLSIYSMTYFPNSYSDAVLTKPEVKQVVYKSKKEDEETAKLILDLMKAANDPDAWSQLNDLRGAMFESFGYSKKVGDHYLSEGMSLIGFKNSYPNAKLIQTRIEFGISTSIYKLDNYIIKFYNGNCISIE